ncbi:MAG: hypothetical protein GXO59_00770 [Dictyoglomi bacterium]|nr:hypothetical protein [Dictyoglomota bacterium]
MEIKVMFRLGGEIGIKAQGTRERMIEVLMKNIVKRSKRWGIPVKPYQKMGKWWIDVSSEQIDDIILLLRTTPGVSRVSKALVGKEEEWKDMLDSFVPQEGPIAPYFFIYKTDNVDKARQYKKEILSYLTSLQKQRFLAAESYDGLEPLEVSPVSIGAELKNGQFIMWDMNGEAQGMQGLPIHVEEAKAGVLFSGGPDSVLAALLLMRRGVDVELIYMDQGVKAMTERVRHLASGLADVYPEGKINLIIVPWREFLTQVTKEFKKNTCMVCKYSMLKVASFIAKKRGYQFIAMGTIVGEQASQTPYALTFTERGAFVPVMHPVAGYAKEEIFDHLARFGMRKAVEKAAPGCEFVPPKVVSKPRISVHDLRKLKFPKDYKVEKIDAQKLWQF